MQKSISLSHLQINSTFVRSENSTLGQNFGVKMFLECFLEHCKIINWKVPLLFLCWSMLTTHTKTCWLHFIQAQPSHTSSFTIPLLEAFPLVLSLSPRVLTQQSCRMPVLFLSDRNKPLIHQTRNQISFWDWMTKKLKPARYTPLHLPLADFVFGVAVE